MLETDRLILRQWQDTDIKPFCCMNQDPKVMQYFPSLQSEVETLRLLEKIKSHFDEHGFSLYATERKDTHEFIGFIGLLSVGFEAHFTPAIEIGWRLAPNHWGQGFATEGAKAVLAMGFKEYALPEIVSFTAEINIPSRRVMEKIGLMHDIRDDFDHPRLSENSLLQRHVLYRLSKEHYKDKGEKNGCN